jgi:hypothetical protein
LGAFGTHILLFSLQLRFFSLFSHSQTNIREDFCCHFCFGCFLAILLERYMFDEITKYILGEITSILIWVIYSLSIFSFFFPNPFST